MIDVIAGLLVPLSIQLMLMFNVCVIYRACVYLCLRQSTAYAPVCFCLCSAVSRQFVSSTPTTAESVQSVQVALYSDILTIVLQRHFLNSSKSIMDRTRNCDVRIRDESLSLLIGRSSASLPLQL